MRVFKNQHAVKLCLTLAASAALMITSCKKNDVGNLADAAGDSAKTEALSGRQFTLTADAYGHLSVDNKNGYYKPGDVINLKGSFKAVYFYNLKGTSTSPIIVKNPSGAVTTIGNPGWSSGAYAEALRFENCQYIKLGGETSKSQFKITGSTAAARQAYFNLILTGHSDNFEVKNITITNGGTGIWAKTDPLQNDPSTWHPNSYMYNLRIHDVEVTGNQNEAFYIGHTATYLDLNTNLSFYGDPSQFTPGHKYVQPIKWKNVKLYNNLVHDGGGDGIQTAAIDGLEVYGNEVRNWATNQNPSHNGGILIGGRTTNTNVHDNYVHDGWGELLQFYGSGYGSAKHVIHNNLFRDNKGAHDGISLRGIDNAQLVITNNTVLRTGGNSVRINGYDGRMTAPQTLYDNALIQPRVAGGVVEPRAYIYVEGGGTYVEGTGALANKKIATVTAALIDITNYCLPKAGSPLGATGFRK